MLCLAPLCKQPFAVVPITGIAAVLLLYPLRKVLPGLLIGLGLILVLGIWFVLGPYASLVAEMLRQSFGATDPSEIWGPGLLEYLSPSLLAVGFTIFWFLVLTARHQHLVRATFWTGFGGFVLLYLGIQTFSALQSQTFIAPRFGFYHGLFLVGVLVAGSRLLLGERKMALVGLLLASAWASGISWGYPTPALFSLPALFALNWFMGWELGGNPPKWLFPALTVASFLTFFLLYQFPYRDAPRSEMAFDLGDHSPRLSGIQTGATTYTKYGEVQELSQKFKAAFTVLPAMPLAHYANKNQPPISVDWPHDAEIAYGYGLERILIELEEKRPLVFMDKEHGPKEAQNPSKRYRSSLTGWVLSNWEKIEETKHYAVYRHP